MKERGGDFMYCHQCGKEVNEESKFCPNCGTQLTQTQKSYQPIQTNVVSSEDAPSMGFAILSFFIPIVGLILFLVWKDEFPQKSKSCLKGLISGIVAYIVVVCCFVSVFFKAVTDATSDYDHMYFEHDGITENIPYDDYFIE